MDCFAIPFSLTIDALSASCVVFDAAFRNFPTDFRQPATSQKRFTWQTFAIGAHDEQLHARHRRKGHRPRIDDLSGSQAGRISAKSN